MTLSEDTINGYTVELEELARTGDYKSYRLHASPRFGSPRPEDHYTSSFQISMTQYTYNDTAVMECIKRGVREIEMMIQKQVHRFKYPQDILERHLRMGLNLL